MGSGDSAIEWMSIRSTTISTPPSFTAGAATSRPVMDTVDSSVSD